MAGKKQVRTACAAAALGVTSLASAAAVTAPYTEDFSDGVAQNHTTFKYTVNTSTTLNAWTPMATAYQHYSPMPGSGLVQFGGSVVEVTGLAPQTDWKVEARVNVSDLNTTWPASIGAVGLVGMAKNHNVGQWNGDALYYAGLVRVAGNGAKELYLQIGRGNNSAGTLAGTAATGGVVALPADFALNTDYTMALVGDFDASGNLTLSFTVGGTTITTPTPIAAGSVLTGNRFGIRDYNDNYRNMTVTYDNLYVGAVPEPTTAALVGMVSVGALARRRRA